MTPTRTATGTPTHTPVPLASISSSVYNSEHSLFVIPSAGSVLWSGGDSWGSVYSSANLDSYINTLTTNFPDDYFFVVVTAINLLPNRAPSVLKFRAHTDGIGQDGLTETDVPNICRYPITGTVSNGAYSLLDREIGHNWGVSLGSEVGLGQWLSNSTASGQLAEAYSDDGFRTVKRISGNPTDGFTWTGETNYSRNLSETFSDYDLYLQGLAASFPDLYVLNSPDYNPDQSVTYSSVATYDQDWVEDNFGVRSPDYQSSPKKFRIGFIFVARDLAEIQAVYQPIERSINSFVNGEAVDSTFRNQVPFLVETKHRASVDALLEDLNGNTTPTLSITGGHYFTSSDGTASITISAADPDGGAAPVVSCVPVSSSCSVSGTTVSLSGLASGSHFFTIKAQDAGGKKAFEHFVVDVD